MPMNDTGPVYAVIVPARIPVIMMMNMRIRRGLIPKLRA